MSQTISLNDAKTMTHAWQDSTYGSSSKKAVKFDADDVQSILDEDGCEDMRVYFALNGDDDLTAVLVGVDSNNSDLTSGPIIDFGTICPPNCDPNTQLIK